MLDKVKISNQKHLLIRINLQMVKRMMNCFKYNKQIKVFNQLFSFKININN